MAAWCRRVVDSAADAACLVKNRASSPVLTVAAKVLLEKSSAASAAPDYRQSEFLERPDLRRKAALSDRDLLRRETGTIYKEWGGRLAVALAFPNTYYLGMSSLALHTLYHLLNAQPTVVCERVFWNGSNIEDRPLRSLESNRELGDFAALAFSVSFEMDYFNLVTMLRQARLPLWAEDWSFF